MTDSYEKIEAEMREFCVPREQVYDDALIAWANRLAALRTSSPAPAEPPIAQGEQGDAIGMLCETMALLRYDGGLRDGDFANRIEQAVNLLKARQPAPAEPVSDAEQFCDSHCVWTDHHADCTLLYPFREAITAAKAAQPGNPCVECGADPGQKCYPSCVTQAQAAQPESVPYGWLEPHTGNFVDHALKLRMPELTTVHTLPIYTRSTESAAPGAVDALPAKWRKEIAEASLLNKRDLRPERFVNDLTAALAQPAPAEPVSKALTELIDAGEAFQNKFWDVAERHNDRSCDHDVCPEVRRFRAALTAAKAAQPESVPAAPGAVDVGHLIIGLKMAAYEDGFNSRKSDSVEVTAAQAALTAALAQPAPAEPVAVDDAMVGRAHVAYLRNLRVPIEDCLHAVLTAALAHKPETALAQPAPDGKGFAHG